MADRIAGLTGDLGIKAPARAYAAANITLSGLQTIDGVVLAEGDRVLVGGQTSSIANGIYNASSGAWSRSSDCDGARDLVGGTTVYVVEGTVYTGVLSVFAGSGPLTPGVSALSLAASPVGLSATASIAAAASAAAALVSQNSASSSASTATTQAGIATTQAGNASTSAGTATTQAGVATTQAGIATTKAAEAAVSAAAAAAIEIATPTHAATSKATPVDADELPLVDSAASFGLKKLTWANLKTVLAAACSAGWNAATASNLSGSPTFFAPITNSLTADVDLGAPSAGYVDGPSVAQGSSGKWFVSGNVLVGDKSSTFTVVNVKLWDGTTVIASARAFSGFAEAGIIVAVSLSGYITSPTGNLRISCENAAAGSTNAGMRTGVTGAGKENTITAIRIG